MAIKTVSFRTEEEKLNDLDRVAEAQHRDRTFILNAAIDNYLQTVKQGREMVDKFSVSQAEKAEAQAPRKPGIFKGVFELGPSFDEPFPQDELRLWSGE